MLYAGLDWSGTPNLKGMDSRHDPYVVVVAGVEDVERFTQAMRGLRFGFGMKAEAEFHAHNMPEEHSVQVVEAAQEAGLAVGALLVDKALTRQTQDALALPSPPDLQALAALAVVEVFVRRYSLTELRFDEDIQGRKRQQEFVTAVKRIHRAVWPATRVKVQPLPSHKSDLIQLADVVAYLLGREARASLQTAQGVRLMQALREDARNTITKPKAWDGRGDDLQP